MRLTAQIAPGGRTWAQGVTLSGLALRLWGDANLWYKLATANGQGPGEALAANTTLAIPGGVQRASNSAATFRPYDPSDALGDLSPTTPVPQAKGNKCGASGAILLVAVAVAVTVVTSGAIVAVAAHQSLGAGIGAVLGTSAGAGVSVGFGTGLAAGTVGAAVGSAASQGIGIATGLQDKFSWKGVGIASLTAFLGPVPIGKVAGSAFVGNVIGGALTSAAVQGVAIASGLQSKFDWAGAAAAGVGGAVVASAGGAFRAPGSTVAAAAQQFAAGAAGAIANAASRSLLTGTSFGDNVLAALPETIGSTIGRAVGERIAGTPKLAVDPSSFDADSAVTYTSAAGARQIVGGVTSGGGGVASSLGVSSRVTPVSQGDDARADDIVVIANRMSSFAIRHLTAFNYQLIHGQAAQNGWDAGQESQQMVLAYGRQIAAGNAGLGNFNFGAFGGAPSNVGKMNYPGFWKQGQYMLDNMPADMPRRLDPGYVEGPGIVFDLFFDGLITGGVGLIPRALESAAGRIGARLFSSEAAKGTIPQVTLNKAAGDAFEADVIANLLPKTQVNIRPQITIKSSGPSGLRVRLDALGDDIATGGTRLSDMKASSTAPFTPNQTVVYPELELYGGVVVGKGKAPYVGGTSIPPTAVDVIRKARR